MKAKYANMIIFKKLLYCLGSLRFGGVGSHQAEMGVCYVYGDAGLPCVIFTSEGYEKCQEFYCRIK